MINPSLRYTPYIKTSYPDSQTPLGLHQITGSVRHCVGMI